MDIPKTLFATLVKQGRMEMHLTQEALAEKLGISAAYLGDLERHKGGPSLELFCKTMQTLNISADDYVYPNQNKNNLYFVKCFSQKSERKIPNFRNGIFPYISRKHFHMIVVQSVA